MADNKHKVTIDAAWFAELYAKAKKLDAINDGERCPDCAIGKVLKQRDSSILALEKERDELKRKLEQECAFCPAVNERDELKAQLEQERMNKCDEVTAKRLAAAERCIDNVKNTCKHCKANIKGGNYGQAELNMDYCIETIRAYREKEEAK